MSCVSLLAFPLLFPSAAGRSEASKGLKNIRGGLLETIVSAGGPPVSPLLPAADSAGVAGHAHSSLGNLPLFDEVPTITDVSVSSLGGSLRAVRAQCLVFRTWFCLWKVSVTRCRWVLSPHATLFQNILFFVFVCKETTRTLRWALKPLPEALPQTTRRTQ